MTEKIQTTLIRHNIGRAKIVARLVPFCFLFASLLWPFAANAATTITVEAESGSVTAPMAIRTDPASSGGKFVEVPQGSGDNLTDITNGGPGEVSFSINVPQAGRYFIWARTLAPKTRGERRSFYVTGNGVRIREWNVRRSKVWRWNKVAKVSLAPGILNLAFRQRDDGTKLDQIALTDGRRFVPPVASSPPQDFTIIALPDTQFYSRDLSPIFSAQTQWIVNNKDLRNIVYVAHLGDCVENGNSFISEWDHADAAMSLIENPNTTGLLYGIPYGIAVGNHDQTPNSNPNGSSTQLYNTYFGASRFSGRNYYGGHFGTNNDNHFSLFSASGMDFIVVYLEYDPAADPTVLTWADNLLKTHVDRRAIIVSHYITEGGNPAPFGVQGQAIYDTLKGNANLFLMLAGHRPEEGRRTDILNGNTVHTLMSDYQTRVNGGDGWLRILEFSPANNQIRVRTYSPTLNQFETDADSEFTLSYDMTPTSNVPPVTRVGPDQTITMPNSASLTNSASLNGTVSDDGLPAPPGALTTTWSKVSGPGTVTFANPDARDTTATFSAAGPYLLQLTSDDGDKKSSADVMILVNPQTPQLATLGVEAESGSLTAPMVTQSSGAASGGQFVVAPEGSGDNFNIGTHGGPGQVSLSFSIPQGGNYALWGRTLAPNGGSDSFYVTSGGTLVREWLVPISTGWQWNKIAEVFIGAGTFDVQFRQREDGTQLDQVIMTNDLNFVP